MTVVVQPACDKLLCISHSCANNSTAMLVQAEALRRLCTCLTLWSTLEFTSATSSYRSANPAKAKPATVQRLPALPPALGCGALPASLLPPFFCSADLVAAFSDLVFFMRSLISLRAASRPSWRTSGFSDRLLLMICKQEAAQRVCGALELPLPMQHLAYRHSKKQSSAPRVRHQQWRGSGSLLPISSSSWQSECLGPAHRHECGSADAASCFIAAQL